MVRKRRYSRLCSTLIVRDNRNDQNPMLEFGMGHPSLRLCACAVDHFSHEQSERACRDCGSMKVLLPGPKCNLKNTEQLSFKYINGIMKFLDLL